MAVQLVSSKEYNPIPNPNAEKSNFTQVVDYLGSASGAFRCLQVLEKVSRIAALTLEKMGSSTAAYFSDFAGKLTGGWVMLTLPRLPDVTNRAKDAVVKWLNPPETIDSARTALEGMHDIADAGAAWGYAGCIVGAPTKSVADACSLVSDTTDLAMVGQELTLAMRHCEVIKSDDQVGEAVRQNFVDTQRYAMIKLVKSIASVTSAVLGLAVLALGGPVLPAVALLGLSLVSTVSAIAAQLFKETRPYKMVDFFQIQSPEVLAGK